GLPMDRSVVVAFAIGSALTKAIDEMRVDTVGIEPSGHEIANAHPGSVAPISETEHGPRCPGGSGEHLHPLEGFLDAARAQRTGIGERAEEYGGDVPIHHR